MQVTLTLNHLIILLFCGLLVIIIVYALQLYLGINKEIAAIAARITRFRERMSGAVEQMQQSATDFQSISEEAVGKGRPCREKDDLRAVGISDSIAEFKDALRLLKRGGRKN
jgi:hypothetical protein